jgi:K+/H+ antiporter YhaU regulatory subunit KhtT
MILEDAQNKEEESKAHIQNDITLIGDHKPHQGQINRKYKLGGLSTNQQHKIQVYREKYEKYLKAHNNTAQKEVWKIYDAITAELFSEQLESVLQQVATNEMDSFVEQIIIDEFQV